MIPTWNSLDANDRDRFAAAAAFLKDRLAEFDTIEWALGLEPDRQVERVAIERALSKLGAGGLAEPWAGAWRLIIESWADGVSQHESNMAVYEVRNKLRAGDRSGPVISAIVDLVRPRLEVQSPNSPTWDDFVTRPHRPKKIGDLLSARLTSGRLVDLRVLKLRDVREVPFLLALVNELEAAVSYGLSLAGRIGWDGRGHFLSLGGLNWAGYSSTEIGLGRNRQSDDLMNRPDFPGGSVI